MRIPADSPASQPSHGPAGWDYFDKIYCITLRNRPDRQAEAEAELAKVGLVVARASGPCPATLDTGQTSGQQKCVEFVVVDKHPDNTEQGIFESHQLCFRRGLKEGAKTIVVFEDDVAFRNFSTKRLADAVEFLSASREWDAFFFGCFISGSRPAPFRSILKIRYRCTAHAYVVGREFAQRLIALRWEGLAFDDLLRSLSDARYFTLYPAFAYQSGSSTDNDERIDLDRLRRRFGGMRFGQRWNEFSYHHLRGLIVAHGLIIAGLIAALVIWLRRR